MSFIDDILNSIGLTTNLTALPYRAVLFGGAAGYFENVKAIKSFSKTQVVLLLKKGSITLEGENLGIKKYCQGDAVICGKISSIKVEE